MSVETLATRCVQCGWSKGFRDWDDVWVDGRRVLLHKGGCTNPYESPQPKRVTPRW
jgi:hypothetical protein